MKSRTFKKISKYLLLLLIIFIVFMLFLMAFTQTSWFRSIVLGQLIKQSNNHLNVNISIKELQGNFINGLKFREIILSDGLHEIINIEEIRLSYSLSDILKQKVDINEIIIKSPIINLREEEKVWNIANIMKAAPEESPKEELPSDLESEWVIKLHKLAIENAKITIFSENIQGLPEIIEHMNICISGGLLKETIILNLQEMSAGLIWNDGHAINLKNITADLKYKDNELGLGHFAFLTDNISLSLKALIKEAPLNIDTDITLDLKNLQDIAYFIPEVNPYKSMGLKSKVLFSEESASGSLEMSDEHGKIDLKFEFLKPLLFDVDEGFEYEIYARLSNIIPESFIIQDMPGIIINADSVIKGNTFDQRTGRISLATELHDTVINLKNHFEHPLILENLNLQAKIDNDRLNSTLAIAIKDMIRLETDFSLESVSEIQGISLYADVHSLDIQPVLIEEHFKSDLNFSLRATTQTGLFPVEMQLIFQPSNLSMAEIDELSILALVDDEHNLNLKELKLIIANNVFEAEGYLSQDKESDMLYSIKLNNISDLIAPWLHLPEAPFAKGTMHGTLKGSLDELSIDSYIELMGVKHQDIKTERVSGNIISTIMKDEDIKIWASINAENISVDEHEIEKVSISGHFSPKSGNPEIELIVSPELTLSSNFDFMLESGAILLNWHKLDILIKEEIWSLMEESSRIDFDGSLLSVDNFSLFCKDQVISINGTISMSEERENDIMINITAVEIVPILLFFENDDIRSGLLSLDLQLHGTGDKPQINALLQLEDVSMSDITDLSLKLNAEYGPEEEMLSLSSELMKNRDRLINAKINQPVRLSVTDKFVIDESREGRLSIFTEVIDLSAFDGFNDNIKNLQGKFKVDVQILDPLTDMQLSGNIKIYDGGFVLPELGTSYKDIEMKLLFKKDIVDLNKLFLRSSQGTLNSSGIFTIATPEEQYISDIDFRLDLHSFPLMSTEAIDLTADSRITLSGPLSNTVYGGNVNITRGRINLDKLISPTVHESSDPPLLVKARKTDPVDAAIEEDIKEGPEFNLDNLTGRIKITFPRNFWVRSSDMNIEMRADLDIIKRGPDFEIFGSVATIRGFYVFFGKRFQIERGEILFSGGREINPDFVISTLYSFRGVDRTRKNLRLMVSGNLDDLGLNFELNDQPIEEVDAISYLLFGRSFAELSQGEKTQSTNHAQLIGGVLANRLSEQLTSFLGDSFQLDHMEFSSDTASSQIGVEIGKYITDDIFISYKKDFNLGDTQEQVYEEILVEYRLTDFLFLQAIKTDSRNSGVDLIWRFQWNRDRGDVSFGTSRDG